MPLDPRTREWLLAVLAGEPPAQDGVGWAKAIPALRLHRFEGAALAGEIEFPVA